MTFYSFYLLWFNGWNGVKSWNMPYFVATLYWGNNKAATLVRLCVMTITLILAADGAQLYIVAVCGSAAGGM